MAKTVAPIKLELVGGKRQQVASSNSAGGLVKGITGHVISGKNWKESKRVAFPDKFRLTLTADQKTKGGRTCQLSNFLRLSRG